MRRLLAPVLLGVLLAGCSDGTDADSTAAEPTDDAPVECLPVDQALLDGIAQGAEDGVGDLTLSDGRAVRSPDHDEAYLIAASLSAAGVGGETGVWASNSLRPGGGLILAVDGFAKQFTVWPDADQTAAAIGSADPAVEAARDCATG